MEDGRDNKRRNVEAQVRRYGGIPVAPRRPWIEDVFSDPRGTAGSQLGRIRETAGANALPVMTLKKLMR